MVDNDRYSPIKASYYPQESTHERDDVPLVGEDHGLRSTQVHDFIGMARPTGFEPVTPAFGAMADHPAHVLRDTPGLVFQELSGP
jgi:hypothetical protein